MPTLSRKSSYLILFAILLLSLGLNLYGNEFPLGYHVDEVRKVHFIQSNTQDFKHPILILQTVRFARQIFQVETDQQVVQLGRVTTAIFGTLIVYLTYLIAQRLLTKPYALAAALLTAVSPGLVIHSHYLKEDIAFTFTILFSFVLFFHFAEHVISMDRGNALLANLPWRQIVLLGLAIGLLVSAKYKSGIILFCFFIAPIYVAGLRKSAYFISLFAALGIGFFTFLLVNYPILLAPEIFIEGLLFELNHAISGHEGIYVEPLAQFYTFHLRESLLPSITILPLVLAACFLLLTLFRWRKTAWQERFLIVFLLVFYAILESSPLKPFPGYIRYVVPMLPIVAYLCMRSISHLAEWLPGKMRYAPLLLIAITTFVPLISSVRLVSALDNDTRGQLEAVLAKKQEPIARELYTADTPGTVKSLAELDLAADNMPFCTLIASSFMYDRYLFGSSLEEQRDDVYAFSQNYEAMFEQPFEEITPAIQSFSFSNPTLRIIDLCPPLWSSAENTRLSSFLDTLPGNQDGSLQLDSPSPSPIRPVETARSISLDSDASYPNFLIIPESEPLYYVIDNAPFDPAYQSMLVEPIENGTFEMTDATTLTFLQTVGQSEASARLLADNAVDWPNESGWKLLGYDTQQTAQQLEIITYWRIDALPDGFAERFMTRFYQLFNAEKQMLVNQGGAVGLWGYAVQVGDVLVERVAIPISAEWPSGQHTLSVGLYDPIHNTNFFFETAERPASYTFEFEIK